MLEVRGDHLMMIKVKYTELTARELIAEISDEEFEQWADYLPVTGELVAEFLNSGPDGWQGELAELTGRPVGDGGEIVSVEHW